VIRSCEDMSTAQLAVSLGLRLSVLPLFLYSLAHWTFDKLIA
jgi:hypothetical protein